MCYPGNLVYLNFLTFFFFLFLLLLGSDQYSRDYILALTVLLINITFAFREWGWRVTLLF